MLDEITYPFPNFNGATVEVWEQISNSSYIFLDMWLLIHSDVDKRGPWRVNEIHLPISIGAPSLALQQSHSVCEVTLCLLLGMCCNRPYDSGLVMFIDFWIEVQFHQSYPTSPLSFNRNILFCSKLSLNGRYNSLHVISCLWFCGMCDNVWWKKNIYRMWWSHKDGTNGKTYTDTHDYQFPVAWGPLGHRIIYITS